MDEHETEYDNMVFKVAMEFCAVFLFVLGLAAWLGAL